MQGSTGPHECRAEGTNPKAQLLQRIRDHTAIVGVVGLGYVGLPFAVEKARVGYKVLGIEENPVSA